MKTVWGPIGEQVYERTYSRGKPDGTKEVWPETVERVVNGNCDLVAAEHIEPDERERLCELIETFALIPGGRHLWVAGVEGRQFSFNCHHSGWGERLRDHVGFLMDVLMCGGGSGSSYSSSAIMRLPVPAGTVEPRFAAPTHADHAELAHRLGTPSPDGVVFKVPDTREGWVEALCQLTDLAEDGGGAITFDVSDVRPRGSAILGFGGTASGPGPLVEMLANVAEVLNSCVGRPYSPLDLMDIDHAIAACVISGNIRRSARIATLSWRSPWIFDFINAKADPSKHWSANFSVEIDADFHRAMAAGGEDHPHALAVFRAVIDGMIDNGEPGFWNAALAGVGENAELVPNPCGEIGLESWEPCCLGHINLAHYGTDLAGAAEAARLMSRFLLRATFADVADPRQREVVDRNRRIGVGILGFQEWGAAHGLAYSDIHKTATMAIKLGLLSNEARRAARDYAAELRVPAPIKTTCVAPTGTISTMPGVTAGIHPVFSKYFVRRIRYSADDPLLAEHVEAGRHIEDDLYSADTKVVEIPCRDPILDRFPADLIEQVDEINLLDLLRTQAMVQESWADNAVSFTANVSPDISRSALATAVLIMLPKLKGTTIFPDLSRPQSPYERIDEQTYRSSSGAAIGQAMDECSTGSCPVR